MILLKSLEVYSFRLTMCVASVSSLCESGCVTGCWSIKSTDKSFFDMNGDVALSTIVCFVFGVDVPEVNVKKCLNGHVPL